MYEIHLSVWSMFSAMAGNEPHTEVKIWSVWPLCRIISRPRADGKKKAPCVLNP
jgi:hypothetical protein